MDKTQATIAFSALSQPTRLDVFRLLVKAGRDGIAAGDIAILLDVRQNTLSSNLSILHQAGLVRSQREGRSIRYFADMNGMRAVLEYLMQDCCGGAPGLCQPPLNDIANRC